MRTFDVRGMSTRAQGDAVAAAGGAGSPVALPTPTPVLDIRDLSVSYFSAGGDVRAVRNVDLALGAGEIVGLAGESGCGKSTLAYGAVRLLRPPAVITSGSVRYSGRRVSPGGIELLGASDRELRSLRWREIAIVFQSAMNALNPVLRVRDQLLDALDAHLQLSNDERHDRIETLIDLVGIPRARLSSYPHELSGGMRQRVMIAMALAVEPEVVIMDEPTTGLDVVVQREILQEIFELKDRLGVLGPVHHARPLAAARDRRPRRDHVRRSAGRGRQHRSDPSTRRPPVHAGPAEIVPAPSRRRASSCSGFPARRPTSAARCPAARSPRAARSPPTAARRSTCG